MTGWIRHLSIFLFISVSSLLWTTMSQAGWNSSGGDDFNDHHNPWFLRNTPTIHYCITVDAQSFSANENKAVELVSKAIAYWNEQLARAGSDKVQKVLGIHEFVRKPNCDGQEDIKFQFGYGTLDKKQLEYLRSPNRNIGISVRTQYDSVNLRGRGFVFFASDLGSHKLQTESFVEKPWSHDGLLFRAIVHELGHIFGLPHVGDGIMAETYLERILNKTTFKMYTSSEALSDFFTPPRESQICNLSNKVKKFFHLSKETKCIHLYHNPTKAELELQVYSSVNETSEKILVGNIMPINECKPTTGAAPDIKVRTAIMIRVDEGQNVFSREEIGVFGNLIIGPTIVDMGCSGSFESRSNGKRNPVYYRLAPGSHEILGMIEGSLQVIYSSKVNFMFGN